MPKITSDLLETGSLSNNYNYSYTPVDNLGASAYTLVTSCYDMSGSVSNFKDAMNDTIKEVVSALRDPKNPRVDNTMLRLLGFNSNVNEFHGFQLIENCHPDNYNNVLSASGMTSLYDTLVNSVEATVDYAKVLRNSDFEANAIVFVVTDGDDTSSKHKLSYVKNTIEKARQTEALESILVILIGVNVTDPTMSSRLLDLQANGGVDKYLELKDVSKKSLQQLANFIVSQSLSASASLGTGGPSQILTM